LFKVDFKLDNKHWQTIALSNPASISEILTPEVIEEKGIIAYVNNKEYICSGEILLAVTSVNCITVNSVTGHLIYQDTTIFVLMKAFHRLFPADRKLVVEHSVGDGVFCEVFDNYVITSRDVAALKREMQNIIEQKLPIVKITVPSLKAERIFRLLKRDDVMKNLKYGNSIDIYKCGKFFDYFLRQLAENSSAIKSYDIIYKSPGLILRFARRKYKKIIDDFVLPVQLFITHQEHDKWLNILNIHNVSALNRAIRNYTIVDLIQIEEALHENKIVDIANQIISNKKIKIVLISGPSASGKTTFAKRLSIQLRVNGIFPHVINMDNYFLPRNRTPKDGNGDLDFENLQAVDTKLLNKHLQILLKGQEIEIPKYNFVTGKTESSHRKLRLRESDILLLEGIHGLNEKLTESIPFNQKLKIYVSALNNLNIDAHNRIKTSDSRKIRRVVRDHKFRNHRAEQTLLLWDRVRAGESRNIFPFQENADLMFNSILTYEIAVLKKYIEPLLKGISPYSPIYMESRSILKLFEHIESIEDDIVPNNSILREFIGGSIFKY